MSRRDVVRFDVSLSVVLGLVSTVGFSSWFSRPLFVRSAFIGQYRHGVYRYRILGRELVLGLQGIVGNPLRNGLPTSVRTAIPGQLFTALVIVNLAGFLLTALLIHVVLSRAQLPEPHRSLVYGSTLAIIAATGYVVTPYDQLGYALLLALLVATTLRPPYDLMAPIVAAIGVANRESQLVALAALWAVLWTTGAARRRRLLLIVTTVVALGTYGGLRLVASADPPAWTVPITLVGNLGRATGWIGIVLIAAFALWWRSTYALAGLGGDQVTRTARWRAWLLATPYLAVGFLTGYWFETRLLVPVLLIDFWVMVTTASSTERRRPADGAGLGNTGAVVAPEGTFERDPGWPGHRSGPGANPVRR